MATTKPVASEPPKATKRGRKAGTKVQCAPWTAEEDATLIATVEAWDELQGAKKALWAHAVSQLGSKRTPASVEQHYYYMMRKQGTPVTGGLSAPKTSARVPAAAAEKKRAAAVPAAKRSKVEKEVQLSICAKAPKNIGGLPISANLPGEGGCLGVTRNSRFGKWGFLLECPTCLATKDVEDGMVEPAPNAMRRAPPDPKIGGSEYKFLPCHHRAKGGASLCVVKCSKCGPFVVEHHEMVYCDEKGNCAEVRCECAGCLAVDDEAGSASDDSDGPLNGLDDDERHVFEWLDKCDAQGRCFECGDKHHGDALEYWIPHPQDEGDSIHGVLFCYRCYDSVRNDRRRDLGMSHYSDDAESDCRYDEDSDDEYD